MWLFSITRIYSVCLYMATIVQGCDTRRDEVLLSIHQVPSDDILESLYNTCIRGSDQLKAVLLFYEQGIEQNNSPPSCQKLKSILRRCWIRPSKFEARNERIETGAPAKGKGEISPKLIGSKAGGDACSFRHDENKCGKPTRSSSPAPEPKTKNDGTLSSKGKASQRPESVSSLEIARIPRVIHGILPEKQNRIGLQTR